MEMITKLGMMWDELLYTTGCGFRRKTLQENGPPTNWKNMYPMLTLAHLQIVDTSAFFFYASPN